MARRSIWLRYLVSVAAVLAGVGIRAALNPLLGDTAPLILFLPPVALAAWYGGFGPGMVATMIAVVLGTKLFISMSGPFDVNHPYAMSWMVRALPFTLVGAILSYFAARLEAAREEAAGKERRARGSEDMQRRIFDSVTEFAILSADREGIVTLWSLGAQRIFGYAAAEIVGQSGVSLFTPEDRANSVPQQEMSTAASEGRARDERWHMRKDGSRFFASGVMSPLRNDAGDVIGFIKIARDVTAQQQILQALSEAQRRSESALLAAEMGTFEWDIGSDVVHGDANFLRIFGFDGSAANIKLGQYTDKIHPEDRQRVRDRMNASVATGEDYECEYRLTDDAGGTLKWLLARGRMTRNAGGKVVLFPGVVLDITDRRRIEEASRLDEERYRNLFNQIDEGFCVIKVLFDANGRAVDYRFLDHNRAFEEQTGLQNVTGRRIRELTPNHEQYWFDTYGRVAQTGEPTRLQNHAKALGRWYDVNAFRIGEATDGLVAVLFKDITAQKRRETERQSLYELESAARADAEQASRMKDEFLATISHELRTPLAAIVGWSSLLQAGRADPGMMSEGIKVISRNASAQSQLIEDILDITRITSGKVRLNAVPIDLRLPLEAAIATVANSAEGKQITVVKSLGDDPLIVIGDPERLQQIFWNLLANAIKFTERLGTVSIRASLEAHEAVVEIQDTGKGIRGEFLPYVFDRFRQADMSTTRRQGGLGLGLAIVRNLVELHGGTASVASDGPALGSTFRINLPRSSVDETPPAIDNGVPPPPLDCPPAFADKKVLVVDDEPDARRVVEAMLLTCGATVISVGSAGEALQRLDERHDFDLLVCDIGMPDEDGYSLIQKLRASERDRQQKRLPALALTAYTRPGDQRNVLEAGFDQFMAKPAEPAALYDVLLRMLTIAS